MGNLITLSMIESNESFIQKKLFTSIQLAVLKKKLKNLPLNLTEKTYYYKYIKPKLKAMIDLFNISDLTLKGQEAMLSQRIEKAKQIIKKLERKHKNQKIMISGSFLFNKTYSDIDVFIFRSYHKEPYYDGKHHVTVLDEKSMDSLFFQSISAISISNFKHETFEPSVTLLELLEKYELLVHQLLQKESIQKELRDFLLYSEYFSKKVILSPKQLYELNSLQEKQNIFGIVNTMLMNTVLFRLDNVHIQQLKNQINDYKKLLTQYPKSKNLELYMKIYEGIINYGTRQGKNKNPVYSWSISSV